MKQRIDCLNRIKDLEVQLSQPPETGEVPVPDEKKRAFLKLMETVHRIVDSLQNINTLSFLTQLDGILRGRVLRTICQELQNVIDSGDSESVKKYGELSQAVLQQVDGFICMLDWELKQDQEADRQILPNQPDDVNNDNVF
ncbi:hypothetical protein B9Z55_018862 [Caenorhabditis nigoni]|uniref:Uncharacterized protein n=1 Tax=Caenorhabditis nigoni TaxID=1611254 RepID=A0A2G5TG30_9PELO|nr:hypothetical protein B9Z55_018862 [Caenorhabditis nigoni]